MYVRYQTSNGEGLFQYASDLRIARKMRRADRRAAVELLDWFNLHLPQPPAEAYQPPHDRRVATWSRYDQREHVDRGFVLATLVSRHLVRMQQARTRRPGPIVFQDDWQVVVWMEAAAEQARAMPVSRQRAASPWNGRDRATIRRMRIGATFAWPVEATVR